MSKVERPRPTPVPATYRRQVGAILAVAGTIGAGIAVVAALLAAYAYRAYDFRRDTTAAIEEIAYDPEELAFEGDVTRRFVEADYAGLDALATDLRASRATFANGRWKLTKLYDSLADLERLEPLETPMADMAARSEAWVKAHPGSVTARIVLAEQRIQEAWLVDLDEDGAGPVYQGLLGKASAALAEALAVRRGCPHALATQLRVAAIEDDFRDATRATAVFRQAVAAEPDYQPYYDLYLQRFDTGYGGEASDWQREAEEIAKAPGGAAHLAGAVWFSDVRGGSATGHARWSVIQAGFRDLIARHPDAFELTSAYCYFAADFGDLAETRRLLDTVGVRMHERVWRDRDQFVKIHRWARFDTVEETRFPMRWLPARPRPRR